MAVRLDGQYVLEKEPDRREKVRAIAAWDAQDEYQLSFDEGEVITVLDKFQGNPMYEGLSSLLRKFGPRADFCPLLPAPVSLYLSHYNVCLVYRLVARQD